ncbi:uncharacterized protein LOC141640810 [Silene latifolia]|uniref:uncharacterized protein LOC141640810 n=1 Tax=Silene latifolia TaxID=37657 RepID=UPI003D77CABC
MYANERIGGILKDQEMLPFQDTDDECELQDIKSYGAFFTWNNKQPSETRVFSRIDRALGNRWRCTEWNEYYAQFNPEGEFDHCPCLVTAGAQGGVNKRAFKFFNMWCRSPEFSQNIQENWEIHLSRTPIFQVCKKLKLMKSILKKLNCSLFSDIERNADVAYKIMIEAQVQLQKDPYNLKLMDNEKQARDSYHLLVVSREDF